MSLNLASPLSTSSRSSAVTGWSLSKMSAELRLNLELSGALSWEGGREGSREGEREGEREGREGEE